MVLCDTNIFIYAFNGHVDTVNRIEEIGLEQIALSAITVMELYQGARNKVELAQIKRKIRYYDVVEVDNLASKQAVLFIEKFKLSHNLQIPDAIIGASAVVHQIPLFTCNVKDFGYLPGIILI
jgi:predicted nucleic acid-binding protein